MPYTDVKRTRRIQDISFISMQNEGDCWETNEGAGIIINGKYQEYMNSDSAIEAYFTMLRIEKWNKRQAKIVADEKCLKNAIKEAKKANRKVRKPRRVLSDEEREERAFAKKFGW